MHTQDGGELRRTIPVSETAQFAFGMPYATPSPGSLRRDGSAWSFGL